MTCHRWTLIALFFPLSAHASDLLRRSTGLLHSDIRPSIGADRDGPEGGILYRALQIQSPLGVGRALEIGLKGNTQEWTLTTQTLHARDLFFCLGARNFLPVFGRLSNACSAPQWLALDLSLLQMSHTLTKAFRGRWVQMGLAIHPLANGMKTSYLLRSLRFGMAIASESFHPRHQKWQTEPLAIGSAGLALRSASGKWRWNTDFSWIYRLEQKTSEFKERMQLTRFWISGLRTVWDVGLNAELAHQYARWSGYEARVFLEGGVRFEVDNR